MTGQKKYDFVDALRGIAVLLVVLAHTPVPNYLSALNVAGAYGVQLFFVVSAFTLFLSLSARQNTESNPIVFFFLRRFFRIAPAFYFALVFYLIKDGTAASPWAPEGIKPWQIMTTLLFVNGWFPTAINAVVPGGWSIAVEMTFYLFVPFCFFLITSGTRAFTLFVALVIAGIMANNYLLPTLLVPYADYPTIQVWFPLLWFPAQAGVFALGFIVFFLFRSPSKGPLEKRAVAVSLSLLAVLLLLVAAKFQPGSIPRQFIFAAIFGLLCLSLSANSTRLFVNPVTCYIGKISFSIYLFHFWAISLVHEYVEPSLVHLNGSLTSCIFYICTTTMAILVASITYRLIEIPGQHVGRFIIESLDNRSSYSKSGNALSRSEITTTSPGQVIPNEASFQRTPSASSDT
jgi:peptidoglycan/LPS O-acetylase OafA/YrhL